MATPQRIHRQTADIRDVLDAIDRRATLAHHQARPPSRKPDHQPRSKTHSDPTGATAVEIAALLEEVYMSVASLKQQCYEVAASLSEWAPAKDWHNGIRRCDVEDCARKHHARGYCEVHYRRLIRQEEREGA
jgi:hypothetical protein